MQHYVIATFYKFSALQDFQAMQQPLRAFCIEQRIKGTILLAAEGVNATISGTRAGIDAVLSYLKDDPRLSDLEHKESTADFQPFYRMKVKLKKEIVTLGVPGLDPTRKVGTYIKPKDWNTLISDPEVIVIDTRNDYEASIGTFKGAINPRTITFRQFPDYVKQNLDKNRHKKIAMFCTGGIRCEKATAYMLEQGFDEVYHLEGGVLKYLEEIPANASLWEGECFVFDNRVAVDHQLAIGSYDQCHSCRHPVSAADKASEKYQHGVSCPHCFDTLTERKRASAIEREHQVMLAKLRNENHIGPHE